MQQSGWNERASINVNRKYSTFLSKKSNIKKYQAKITKCSDILNCVDGLIIQPVHSRYRIEFSLRFLISNEGLISHALKEIELELGKDLLIIGNTYGQSLIWLDMDGIFYTATDDGLIILGNMETAFDILIFNDPDVFSCGKILISDPEILDFPIY